jgi:predicted AlkP superfamily pyrophosphatase or phosphodiesterase
MRSILPCLLGLMAVSIPSVAFSADAPARRVVVVTWDGMRPDFISQANTPNLWKLREEGVAFARHHPVFLSSTEVNGTALATGVYPSHSGVIANNEFRPAVDPLKPIEIQKIETIRKGDEVEGGRYLHAPTLAEILHAHGQSTVIAGSKDVVYLLDRAAREAGPGTSTVLAAGTTLPASAAAPLVSGLGEFPATGTDENKLARDTWTTLALVRYLWKDAVPAYSHLWLAEPDALQHSYGPGTPLALEGIRNSDRNLGLVLAELERRGLRDTTDILVVSDHGFSTISRKVDVAVELSKLKFEMKRATPSPLQKGEVLAVSNGGSTLLYVGDHDPETCARLVTTLQAQDWTGVIFARSPAEGTFPLSEVHVDTAMAPDFVVSLRWTDGGPSGAPGTQTSDLAESSPRKGNHASLSPYDMHNTLVASGPDFRKGITDPLPTASTDVAPTVLWILGYRDEVGYMDGRVLGEALTGDAPALRSLNMQRLTARRGLWNQYLEVTELNGVRYLEGGNGGLSDR